ncbi:MAG TPA: hypothetical protein VFO01_15430 [Trebonia sp.]|nr:hypothetical protein [Trebonia sp.]
MSECPAGCCPHDSARLDEGCPRDLPDAPVPERVAHLRSCQLLPVARIAALTGIDRQRVTRLLYEAAAPPGGAGQRPARRDGGDDWPDVVMAPLSGDTGTVARRTGPPSARGPSEAELLTALYADPEVCRVLDKHGIPVATLAGPVWKRFPAPQPLSGDLVSDLYEGCGLGLHHIELLTGRPAAAAGAVLRAKGIQLRPAGGTSPFTRRWRQGQRQE